MIIQEKSSFALTDSQKFIIFSQYFAIKKRPSTQSAMHAASLRRLLVKVFLILFPVTLAAQVTIRERVTIAPKPPDGSKRDAVSRTLSYDYFAPPLFIHDHGGSPALPLPANLSIDGEVDILGAIGGNQQAVVVLVLSPYLEHRLAWKGREPISWGGKMYEGTEPYTGAFSKGSAPNVQLYVFDGQWGTGAREVTNTGDALSFEFTSYLNQGTLPRVDVTGSATVTGGVLPAARLDRWEVDAYPTTLECSGGSSISFFPVDGYGQFYEPYGIPRSVAEIMLSVEAKGEYAYLASGAQEGKEITVSLTDRVYLMLDVQREAIPGERDTAIVTISGGGKTAQVRVALVCEKLHHFRITADPGEVDHGLQSKLTVTAEDINDQEVIPEEDFDIRLSLSSPDIIIGSVRDTSARLPHRPRGFSEKGGGRFMKLQDGIPLYGSFSIDGGAPQPDAVTVLYSLAREGRVYYVADGQIPYGDYPERVTVNVGRVDGGWQSGSVDITVNPTICAQVTFDPPVVSPGDTAVLSFKKILEDGTLEDFPADQLFNIAILSGGDRGVLVSGSGETGTTLAKVSAPVWYVAPGSIEGDTLVVGVIATAAFSTGGGGASSVTKTESAAPLVKILASDAGRQSTVEARKKIEIESVREMLLARAGEACALSEVVVVGVAIHHFAVIVTPDTVHHGKSANVKIQAKDEAGGDLKATSDTKVNIVLGTDEKYGNLHHQGATGKTLLAVPYEDANSSTVSFLANGENPIGKDPQKVQIGMTKAGQEAIGGSGWAVVKCHLSAPLYRQGSGSEWAQDTYDHSAYTIGDLGCALSCMAISMTSLGDTIDPGTLNTWMTNRKPYEGGYHRARVNWEAMSRHSPEKGIKVAEATSVRDDFNLSVFDDHLLRCELIIAKVFNPESVKNKSREEQIAAERDGNHWVVIVSKNGRTFSILDPGRGLQTLSDYGKIYRYVRVHN